ncbi:MAG: hypothetical protein HY360_06130 [Verrucomicrobia bacterium]|nr:hypothetical protein [Verrucomicrobiota bacterium]
MRSNTDWFKNSKWGIFVHFLAAEASTSGGAEISAEQWNARVAAFDVRGLAEQLRALDTKYIFITLGQNSGHFCAPNASYDRLVGIKPSKCSQRDLVGDLWDELHGSGIRVLVYAPAGAPEHEPLAVERLGWKANGGRLAEFQHKWEAIIRDWSVRWGPKVSGWWLDGCYYADDMYRHPEPPNFQSFRAALLAGNPDGIVAFNPGIKVPIISMTEYEDYTAGEINIAFPVNDKYHPPLTRWVDGAQHHILSFLGDGWGVGRPRFPVEFVVGFTRYTNQFGGVVSWDVPTQNGLIPPPFMEQLRALRDATRKG